jgi:hypothetical protein
MLDRSNKDLSSDANGQTLRSPCAPSSHAPLRIVLDDSVPKGLGKQVKVQLATDTFRNYLSREFAGKENLIVRGKKSGEVELKRTAEGITLALSPDGGAWKRFEQKVTAAEEKETRLAAFASQSIPLISESRRTQSTGQLVVEQWVNDLTKWAQSDFKGEPAGSVRHHLTSRENDGAGAKNSWIKRISQIGTLSDLPGIDEELHAWQQGLEKEIERVARRIQPPQGTLDKEAVAEHGAYLGQIAMVSLTRFFSEKNRDHLRFLSKEIDRVFLLSRSTFDKGISNALRNGDFLALEPLLETAQILHESWKKNGVFAVLHVLDVELQSPTKLREQYESSFMGLASGLNDLLHSMPIIENDSAPEYSETLPIMHLLPSIEGVLPSLDVPTAGDLRPYKDQVFRFGRELIAIARSSDPKVTEWYRYAASGRRYDVDASLNRDQQFDEDFPEYVLELLYQMCAWASSAAPRESFPFIQAGNNLYAQLIRSVISNGALTLFEEITEQESTTPLNVRESYYNSFEKLLGMLKEVEVEEIQCAFLSLAKYFGKFEVVSRQATEALEAGALKEEKILRESAVEVMIGCGKYFLGLNKKFQEDLEEEVQLFLARLTPTLDALDGYGELGRQLTAIETGIAMLNVAEPDSNRNDGVVNTSELAKELRARHMRITRELIEACKYAGSATLKEEKDGREADSLLNCVDSELKRWEYLGAFPGSRSHCLDELRKSRSQVERNRRLLRAGKEPNRTSNRSHSTR